MSKLLFRSPSTYSTLQGMLFTSEPKYPIDSRNNDTRISSLTNNNGTIADSSGFDYSFNSNAYIKPTEEDLKPNLDGYLQPFREEINTFLNENLIKTPERAGFLSQKLKTTLEVVKEAQRLHFRIIGGALKGFRAALLLDMATHENKGDPCIAIGEVAFLARINLPIIYYCSNFKSCNSDNFSKARKLASKYSTKDLVILVHGGGNLIGYPQHDEDRFKILDLFTGYKVVVFPQSVYIPHKYALYNLYKPHILNCEKMYCCNENLTLILRDQQSFDLAKEHFNGSTTLLMAPDMAFQIGPIRRFMSPVFDVMWLKRADGERVGYSTIPKHPPHIRFHVSDWLPWTTNTAPNGLEQAVYVATNGMMFLTRGRVVVTDRLHGHIVATLMNIPHVILDNKEHKLSAYHTTWTKSLDNTVLTYDSDQAMTSVLDLLTRYESQVPPRLPFMDVSENFLNETFEDNESSYP